MKSRKLTLFRCLVVVLSLFAILACRSQAPTANEPGVTPPNAANTNAAGTDAQNANAPAASPTNTSTATAQPASGCGDCWLRIYDDKNFKETDDHHLICGPGKWPNLRNLAGATKLNWGDEIESLKVGPAATVTVWVGEGFTGASHKFSPGAEQPTLRTIPGLSDTISSIEISCQ